MLTPKSIKEFQDMYWNEYKIRLTTDQAIHLGTQLIKLIKAVFGDHVPKEWKPKKVDIPGIKRIR